MIPEWKCGWLIFGESGSRSNAQSVLNNAYPKLGDNKTLQFSKDYTDRKIATKAAFAVGFKRLVLYTAHTSLSFSGHEHPLLRIDRRFSSPKADGLT